MKPSSPAAFQLLMEGAAAFADIEENGLKVDVPYLDRVIKETETEITQIEDSLRRDEVFKVWEKKFGSEANLGSKTQLGTVIFDIMGVPCKHRTKTGRPKTDIEALETVDFPFIVEYLACEKLKKARSTYLVGLRHCVEADGYVHPSMNLHFARTYRSSIDDPNLQNQPVRNPKQAKLIRTAFIPSGPDYCLVERDYSALEFRGAANFWVDRSMITYASDNTLDIHRDIAAELFACTIKEVSKPARSTAKNAFVFPVLYGSTHRRCHDNIWNQISRTKITTQAGVDMFEHLASKGIKTKDDFKMHVKKVEDRFGERFPTWNTERVKWWELYESRGWFPLSTGFIQQGVFSYNDLMNYPIQGPSFHIMLWSIIQINKWLKKNKMKSKIATQVHDSILLDVYKSELDDVLAYSEYVMTIAVRKHWPWIVTPLEIETEISYTNWFEKQKYTAI